MMLKKRLSIGLLTLVMAVSSLGALFVNAQPAAAATECDRFGRCWHDNIGPRDWHRHRYHHWRWVHNVGRPGWHRVWY